MSRLKLLIGACFTFFVLCVPASAIAFPGGQWLVEKKLLLAGESEEFLPTALVLAVGELKVLPAGPNIRCNAHEIGVTGGKIIGPDGILATSISFKGCEGEGACTEISGEEIKTLPLHGLALLDLPGSLNAYIHLLPETKTTFAVISFPNTGCALFPSQPVTGTASLLIHGALHELLLHLVLAFTLPKALKVGSSEADLKGLDFDIALKSHKLWSFH